MIDDKKDLPILNEVEFDPIDDNFLDSIKKPSNPDDIDELSKESIDAINRLYKEKHPDLPTLFEICKSAFGEEVDPRTKRGRLVRNFLKNTQLKALTVNDYVKKKKLNQDQAEYIKNNCETMKISEMAEAVFGKKNIQDHSTEFKLVSDLVKSLMSSNPGMGSYEDPDDVAPKKYNPPNTMDRVVARINKYVDLNMDANKLKQKEKEDCKALIGYMKNLRFCYQIESYKTMENRNLFESTFVRCCYNKGDLTEEEVDQYIIYSTEVIISKGLLKTLNELQEEMGESIYGNEDEHNGKLHMSLVEYSSSIRTDYNQSIARQQKLLQDLKIKRSQRLASKKEESQLTVAGLFKLWKEEDSRKQMIELAELRKDKLSEDFDKIDSMDALKAQIMGIDKNEVING